ncbi:MAG: tetratricopeptide repeat protein, partial [Akkermansiaceae bacterium]|nr:tetratricopeptide repeat protein [Armatimonadota bacterium]
DVTAGRNSLSVALNSLRQQFEPMPTPGSGPLGDFLIADRSTVRLCAGALSSDVMDFEAASIPAKNSEPLIEDWLQAERLYRGELLPGYFDDWVVAERERIAALYLQVLHHLTAAFLARGDRSSAVQYLHRAAAAAPFDDETNRLMAFLTPDERMPTSRVPAAEMGSGSPPPSPLVLTASAQSSPLPPPRKANSNLPVQFNRFFGREEELRSIEAALGGDGGTRLLTLTGTGGAGKTRLSIESAARLGTAFSGGTYFVALADLSTPVHLGNAIRDAMGLSRAAPTLPLAQVVAALEQREPCLLVLDNLEHLIRRGPVDDSGIAAAVRTLLSETTTTVILATSRQLLGLPGERELPIAPLPLPTAADDTVEELLRYPAVQLFVNRAQMRRVDFRLTVKNGPAVTGLCARLEGVPLAIELAASWAKLLTPAQMLERLDDGFAFLESRHPAVPERHRSLWAAAAWSYVLLTPEVRRFFARLSVFRGGCTPEAATAVCGDDGEDLSPETALEYLGRLYDASLLVTEEARVGPEQQMRLGLREPIRDFAGGQLTPEEHVAMQRRHATYFLRLAEDAEKQLTGPEQQRWFDLLESEKDNIRAVLTRHTGDEIGLRIAGALARFWTIRGYFREGADWLHQILEAPENRTASPARTKALHSAGTVAYHRTDLVAAVAYFRESLRMAREAGDAASAGKTILNIGNVAYRRGDFPEAQACYEETLTIHRARGDDWGVASALGSLGNVAQGTGDYAAARAFQEQSLALSRALGDTRMTAYTLHNLGNLAGLEGDPERARLFYEEALPRERALGDRRGVAALLTSLANLALQSGDFGAARCQLAEAISLIRDVEDRLGMLLALDGVAWYAQMAGSGNERAVVFWAASQTGRAELVSPRSPGEEAQFSHLQETARQSLPPKIFAAAWARGDSLSLDAAILLAQVEVAPDTTPPA